MSKFTMFMRQNKIVKLNEKYAPTDSLLDENGKPLEWEFRHLSSKENDELRDACTRDVQVTGKPNVFRPRVDTSQYLAKLAVASTVVPDLYDAELQDSYGVSTPEDLLYALVDDAGEYQELCAWIQRYQGFTKGLEDKVEAVKK